MKPEFNEDDQSASYDTDQPNPETEVTREELEALTNEVDALYGGDIKLTAQNLLEEASLKAVMQLSKLAVAAGAERVRLDASKYILERVLGPLNKLDATKDVEKDPMYKFIKALQDNMEEGSE